MLCIASLHVSFKCCTNEYVMQFELAVTLLKQPKTSVVCKLKVQLITLTKWFKKFFSGFKKLVNKPRSGRPKTEDFKAILKAIELNLASSTSRISDEFSISWSCVVCYLHFLCKKYQEMPNFASCYQVIAKIFIHFCISIFPY